MRYWVYLALCHVINEDAYSNLYLKKHLNEVNSKDRALATQIFYGTLQNYRYLEACWKIFTRSKVNDRVAILMNMSVYQLLFLDKVPDYAIINEAVEITKKISKKHCGMVNAILRKVKPIDCSLAVRYSLPDWIIKMWQHQYGKELTIQMAKASTCSMPLLVRKNQMHDISLELKPFHDLYIFDRSNYENDPDYLNGYISAQDEGSYKISQYLECKENDIVLDCCSAPGTKAMAIAEMMNDHGHIDCLDIYEHRVKLIEQDKKRLHLNCIQVHVQDATNLSDFGLYDRILCDVPCSGYGVLARKPDIKLKMNSTDMDKLIPLQYQILNEASKHLKKDGTLVYSTCTINKKENEKQIEKFIKEHDEFECIDTCTIFPDTLQDGFFMAKLKYR